MYFYEMNSVRINIINPKAEKLLKQLVELRLISFAPDEKNQLIQLLNKIRSKNPKITLEEITNEVEKVRAIRNGK